MKFVSEGGKKLLSSINFMFHVSLPCLPIPMGVIWRRSVCRAQVWNLEVGNSNIFSWIKTNLRYLCLGGGNYLYYTGHYTSLLFASKGTLARYSKVVHCTNFSKKIVQSKVQ